MDTTTACPRCTARSEIGDRFCSACGASLPAPTPPAAAPPDGDAVTAPLVLPALRIDETSETTSPSGADAAPAPSDPSQSPESPNRITAGDVVVGMFDGVASLWNFLVTLAVMAGVGLWLFTACSGHTPSGSTSSGSGELTASTTCDEYLAMDQESRYTGAQQLGRKADGSTFRGPMAGANLDYSCSESRGSRTVGSLMGVSG